MVIMKIGACEKNTDKNCRKAVSAQKGNSCEERMTNSKPRKNDLIFSVERKGGKPRGGEILDESEFVGERNVLSLGLP